MKKFVLKDGRKIDVDTWGFKRLKEYVSGLPTCRKGMSSVLEGFAFFGPTPLYHLESFKDEKYSEASNLSLLEIQQDRTLPNQKYHRALVALHESVLCGIFLCDWGKRPFDFWKYHTKHLDVHEDYRNLGVGTRLVKSLDQADFLESKILQIGTYTVDGENYIQKVMERELKGKNYALIPEEYYDEILGPPLEAGVYDIEGKLKEI